MCWASIIWHSAQLGRQIVSSMHQPHFTTKEIPWYSFLFEAERTPGLPNLNRADIQGAYWELNPKPPILRHSAPNMVILRNTIYQPYSLHRTFKSKHMGAGQYHVIHTGEKWLYDCVLFSSPFIYYNDNSSSFFHIPSTLTKSNCCQKHHLSFVKRL